MTHHHELGAQKRMGYTHSLNVLDSGPVTGGHKTTSKTDPDRLRDIVCQGETDEGHQLSVDETSSPGAVQ